ncbi:Dipeptidyl peptidase 2 [Clonorchis sinensis]|uniref:Dipeptidyl peptidase 2 n=1 Tax=Clonorchis sinensis TaxID=79923 RepID=A0A8T1MV35_CLOSI|nr:Dipeptidyl peptidase 2 [Clonorchis sinensis]
MIYLTIVAVFCLLDCSANQFDIPRPPKEQYFTQRVDHMNFQPANITYRMRYLYEDKWYKSGGPIFFYCGNEGDIFGFWNNSGFIFHLASKMDAMVVFAEHRYYGKSLPFKNSFSQPYIQFLSIEQTLADYANLIQHLKEKYGRDNTAVIAFGGSYGGMLAAYMRASYPHLVAGAIASSAPVNWVAGLGNIHQFFEHVTDDYNQVNPQCVARVKNAYDLLERMVMEDIRALASISKQMKLCKPMHTIFDFVFIFLVRTNAFVMMTMLDYPTDNTFISQLPAYPVNVSCAKILAAPDVISALRDAVSVWYNSSKDLSCFDYKTQFTDCADDTGCGTGNDALAWDFQSCTEMNLFDPSESTTNVMFPALPKSKSTVESYCRSRWGVVPAFNQLATFYSPKRWKWTSNIVFSNGDLDPWMRGGILEDPSPSVRALIIHGGAHHLDLRMPNPADPPSVRNVRDIEEKLILSWIDQDRL